MDIKRSRKEFRAAFRDLRRARRLYISLIYKAFKRDPGIAVILAQRGISRGLWSCSRPLKDGVFSIWRGVWQLERRRGYRNSWHCWLHENGYSRNPCPWHGVPKLCGGSKPRIRVVG